MKVIIDVNPADLDWGHSKVHKFSERGPDDAVYWDVDVDLDHAHYTINGQPVRVSFVDDDEACQWFLESYKEGQAA
jgi:hypothetical protein